MIDERVQDAWFVSVVYRKYGRDIFKRSGVLDLPFPMTDFDASGYGLAVELRDIVSILRGETMPHAIDVVVWGKRGRGLAAERRHMCTAVAEYDEDQCAFMRLMPWINDKAREKVGTAEGAVFHPVDWQ